MHPIRTWASLCGIKAEGFPPLGHSVPVAGVAASAHPYAQSFEGTPALQVTTSLRSSPGVPSTRLSRTGTSRRRVVGGSPRRAPLPPSHGEAAASGGGSTRFPDLGPSGSRGSGPDQRNLAPGRCWEKEFTAKPRRSWRGSPKFSDAHVGGSTAAIAGRSRACQGAVANRGSGERVRSGSCVAGRAFHPPARPILRRGQPERRV